MFSSRIPQITAELLPRLEAATGAGAELIAERAKQRVPVNTGALRDAIHVEPDDGGFAVIAGNTEAFYGHIIEHGAYDSQRTRSSSPLLRRAEKRSSAWS